MAKQPEQYSEVEAQTLTDTALRAAFRTPQKTYKESKIGKRKGLGAKSPRRRKAVKKLG